MKSSHCDFNEQKQIKDHIWESNVQLHNIVPYEKKIKLLELVEHL